jgi:hypothetical protein
MATTTRNDTTYSSTLLRLHVLEEVMKAVRTEMEALWDALEDLEPGGGGSGDQDRIYNITVKGGQVGMIDDVPQGPSIYDDFSMHQSIWGTHPDLFTALAAMDISGTATSMAPLAEKIASPWQNPGSLAMTFWTSGKSILTLLVGSNPSATQMYDAIIDAGSISTLAFGNPTNAASMVSSGDSLYEMIDDLESRVSRLESFT